MEGSVSRLQSDIGVMGLPASLKVVETRVKEYPAPEVVFSVQGAGKLYSSQFLKAESWMVMTIIIDGVRRFSVQCSQYQPSSILAKAAVFYDGNYVNLTTFKKIEYVSEAFDIGDTNAPPLVAESNFKSSSCVLLAPLPFSNSLEVELGVHPSCNYVGRNNGVAVAYTLDQ